MTVLYPDMHLHIKAASSLDIHEKIEPVFLNSTSITDFNTVSVSGKAASVFPFFGIHPWFVNNDDAELSLQTDSLCRMLEADPRCGIGECGLDFSQKYRHNRKNQIKAFEFQLELACELRKPLSIHCVKAWGQLLSSIKHYSPLPVPFMLHSFYGSSEVLKQLLDLDAYISLSSLSLRNPLKSKDVIKEIPLNRLLIESDLELGNPDFSAESHFHILQNNYKTIADIISITEKKLISGVIENGKVFSN